MYMCVDWWDNTADKHNTISKKLKGKVLNAWDTGMTMVWKQ